jgi:hypothetical protein
LPFQGANTIRPALPRVSAHPVRLALGYALLAFQAVMETGVFTPICKCFEPELKKCEVLL